MRHVCVKAVAGRARTVYMHIFAYDYIDAENSLVIESRKHSRNTDDKLLQEY